MNIDRCFSGDELAVALIDGSGARSLEDLRGHAAGCESCRVELEAGLELNGRLNAELVPPRQEALNHLRSSIDEMVAFIGELQAPWGPLGVALTERGVTRIEFGASLDRMAELVAGDGLVPEAAAHALAPLERELDEYFAGERKTFDIETDLRTANSFLRAVLGKTSEIPAGSYSTYAGVAADIGHPKAYRAVGNALGSNPIPIIIPCHRVLASGGGIGGYGGGLPIKRYLLELEGATLSPRALAASQ
ncbi:MAG TPA: methylated-DNA--[protein]-cysteine S-methyltransferase [Dehalococcoidia bacterium]|nr:methylated-DNA--[protein]-cysteine S-methyltransferase [Dehalococcoidia bacterium]